MTISSTSFVSSLFDATTTSVNVDDWLILLLSRGVASTAVFVTVMIFTGWHQVLFSILRLLDLLLTVKFTAKRIIAETAAATASSDDAASCWTIADTFEESVLRYSNGRNSNSSGKKTSDFCVMADGEGRRQMTFLDAELASSVVAHHVVTKLHVEQSNSNNNNKRKSQIVALFMPSSCEFVVAMFGLIRAGIPAALVNTSLRGASLVHALAAALDDGNDNGDNKKKDDHEKESNTMTTTSRVCAVLVSPELAPILQALQKEDPKLSGIQLVTCGAGCTLDPWKGSQPPTDFSWKTVRRGVTWDDTAVYIYTSGTTGFPKASKINHLRMWTAGCVTRKVCGLTANDRLYCPLPLYHASACTLGLVATLQAGGTIVLRSKFSASRFSHDVATYQCNSCQYIGEMARYLVAAKPDRQYDGVQPLRFAYGNGMPVEVWEPFQKRYNVQQVNEFYAATEGNVNIFNNTGKAVGACGIVPRGFEWLYPIGLFQHDSETGELVRNEKTGLCVPVQRGQAGELLGLIQQNDPSRRFDGYSNRQATQRKIVHNVCRPGDAYFRSGDLLRQDFAGFLYFCDRVGDTFRWKGENVSTSEVARTLLECGTRSRSTTRCDDDDDDNGIRNSNGGHDGTAANLSSSSSLPLFSEAIVFGVEVPGHPGRAGMATVVMAHTDNATASSSSLRSNDTNWQHDLYMALQDELPRYAQPLFLRITDEIEKTSTQKYKKTQLQKESFVDCGTDLVYLRDDTKGCFVVMTEQVKQDVLSGTRRV